jgi:hypothetical protein
MLSPQRYLLSTEICLRVVWHQVVGYIQNWLYWVAVDNSQRIQSAKKNIKIIIINK